MRYITGLAAALALALPLAACSTDSSTPGQDTPLTVYATTGYIADAVHNIAPDAQVTTMVGPGGDPHTYQPSTRDVETLRHSDLVFSNGLHLEAQMTTQLESLGDRHLALGDLLPPDLLLPWEETDPDGHPLHDPHVWNSPAAWQLVVEQIADRLAAEDPDNAETYRANARTYNAQIAELEERSRAQLAELTAPRILVTGHDAFGYFGQTFDLEVRATDFISTEAALSPTELSELADYIVDNRIPTIFRDNQANPQAITSLEEAVSARGWSVTISDAELFADSLGPQAPVDTYLGTLGHNVATVAAGLGGKAQP